MSSRLAAAAISATLALALWPGTVVAYTYNVYPGNYASQYPDNFRCVAASSVTWVNAITGGTNYSHSKVVTYYDYGRSKNKYTYAANGIDPRGWAWTMFNYTPAGYTFNDYIYETQSAANSKLVYGLRDTGEPVGVPVAKGEHAVLAVGFSSSQDPELGPWTLNGFYIVDPWHKKNSSGTVVSPPLTLYNAAYNLAPNSYISASSWNTYYFRKYMESDPGVQANGGTIWDGFYTVVLRKSSTTEAPKNPWNARPPYSDTHGPTNAMALEPAAASPTIQDAIDAATTSDSPFQAGLGFSLGDVTIGNSLVVETESDVTPYLLVELKRDGRPAAVALVTVEPDGYRLGAITGVSRDFRMPRAADAARALGNPAELRLKWAPSAISPTPFVPIWIGTDSIGSTRKLTIDGYVPAAEE
jgi:hypothetical protein